MKYLKLPSKNRVAFPYCCRKDQKVSSDIPSMETLPEEILLMIFDLLHVSDRRTARRVCKDWNTLLSSPRFTSREVLKLYNCVISPAGTFFGSTTRDFYLVEIRKKVYWESETVLRDFLSSVGKETRTFKFEPHNRPWQFLRHLDCFPKLETLLIEGRGDSAFFREALEKFESSVKPVRRLVIKSNEFYSFKSFLELFRRKFEVVNLLKTFAFEARDPEVHYLSEPAETFIRTHMGQHGLAGIFGASWAVGESFNFLGDEKVQLRDLTRVNYCHSFRDSAAQRRFFEDLQALPGIEELDLDSTDGCFFCHELFKLPSIHTVTINSEMTRFCEQCLSSLGQSCPNIVNWTLESVDSSSLEDLSKYFREARRLSLQNTEPTASLFQTPYPNLESLSVSNPMTFKTDILLNWPPMPQLRRFKMKTEVDLDVLDALNRTEPLPLVTFNEGISHFVQMTPRLEKFKFLEYRATFEDLEDMLRGWTCLRVLKVSFSGCDFDLKKVTRLIREKGRNLQKLVLSDEDADLDWAQCSSLMEQSPALRVVGGSKRVLSLADKQREVVSCDHEEELEAYMLFFDKVEEEMRDS